MRTLIRAALLAPVLSTLLMAGQCSTLSGGPGSGGAFCDIATPQRPSLRELDAMTPERKRQVLALNRYGAANCGWRP